MIFRFRYRVQGGHVHVAVFAARRPGVTFEKMGDLVTRVDEWPHFRALLVHLGGGDDRGDGVIDVEASDDLTGLEPE